MTDNEIQKAVIVALDAAHSTPVLDDVPTNQALPYIRVGDMTEIPFDTDDSVGRESTVNVHTWSSGKGFKELKDLMDLTKQTLHRNAGLVVTGEMVLDCLEEYREAMLDPDGLTRHGVQRFRITTQGA